MATYSAYYTVIPGFDFVLWKLALAMARSSFDVDRALAYALSCVKQGLSLKDQQVESVSSSLKGRKFSCGSLSAMESPYATSYCPSYLMSSWVGPTLPSLTEVSFLLFLPLCLMVHEYYFLCHLSVFSLNFTIVLRHVLLLNLRLQPTRPYTINTRQYYFLPVVILAKNRPGDEATEVHVCSNFLPRVLELNTCFFCVFKVFMYCNLLCTTDEGCYMVAKTFGSL